MKNLIVAMAVAIGLVGFSTIVQAQDKAPVKKAHKHHSKKAAPKQ